MAALAVLISGSLTLVSNMKTAVDSIVFQIGDKPGAAMWDGCALVSDGFEYDLNAHLLNRIRRRIA